jgi:hypothetical protein
VEAIVTTNTFVQEQTEEIRRLAARSSADIVEIGHRLIAVKEHLAHGEFLPWIDREFGWSDVTARRFMSVARAFGQIVHGERFEARALYALASGDVPEEVRQEFVARAEAGEPVRYRDVKEAVEQAKATAPVSPRQAERITEAIKAEPDGEQLLQHVESGDWTLRDAETELKQRHASAPPVPTSLALAREQRMDDQIDWSPEKAQQATELLNGPEVVQASLMSVLSDVAAAISRANSRTTRIRPDVLMAYHGDEEVREVTSHIGRMMREIEEHLSIGRELTHTSQLRRIK